MEQAQTDRALDDPDLALCLCDRRIRLFDAIQVVSSRECDAASRAWQIGADRVVCNGDGNLALGHDLMFDPTDALWRMEQFLW